MVQFITISSLSSTNLRVRNGFGLGHSLFSTVERKETEDGWIDALIKETGK